MSDEAKALAEVSQTVRVLAERFSDAVGGYLKPWQVERTARAEARADITRAIGQSISADIQKRGLQRFVTQLAYEQINIESILRKTVPLLGNKTGRPQDIEQDWIMNFIDKSKLISDEEMQSLWAGILAGETTAPGKFSKRTVNALSSLDKSDAELFSKLVNYSWEIKGLMPLVFDEQASIYNTSGINWETLTHLATIGLVTFDPLSGHVLLGLPKKFALKYNLQLLGLGFKDGQDTKLDTGHVMLTSVGQQLSQIINRTEVEGFFDYVMEEYKKKGMDIFDPRGAVTVNSTEDIKQRPEDQVTWAP